MYAIVEIAGQQFKVEKDQQVFVHRLEEKEGSKVEFDNVLLIDNDGKVTVGAPAVKGALVSAKILEHLKGDKTIVFKKKRRKGYKVKKGHRQYMTKIEIEKITESGGKKKAAAKKSTAKKSEKAEDSKKETTAKKKSAAKAKSTSKKTTEKKSTTKKASSSKSSASEKKKSTKSTKSKSAKSKSSTASKKSKSSSSKKSGGSKKENKSGEDK